MWLQNQRQPQRKSRRRKSHEKDENESTCPVFSMTLTVSALAGNGRLTIQAATSQESSGTKETTEKTAQPVRIRQKIKIRSSKLPMKRHLKNFYRTVSMTAGVLEKR